MLGVLAWAASGGGGKPPSAAPQNTATASALPAAAFNGPPPTAVAGSPPAPTMGARTAPAVMPSPFASPRTPKPAPASQPSSGSGGRAPGSVVLSLFSSRPAYTGSQHPQFQVYAVSTASGSCTVDLGADALQLVVMSAGRVIWDSDDCARGGSKQVAQLTRGVPATTSITWDRAITLPGCVTLAPSARTGTYQAQAKTATASSPTEAFKLK